MPHGRWQADHASGVTAGRGQQGEEGGLEAAEERETLAKRAAECGNGGAAGAMETQV